MKYDVEALREQIMDGAMATLALCTVRANKDNPWHGERAVYETIVHADDYLYQTKAEATDARANNLARRILSGAKMQVVAEGWGAEFPFDYAWSQAQMEWLWKAQMEREASMTLHP